MDQATFDEMADDWLHRNVIPPFPPDLKEATEGCARLGLVDSRHPAGKPVTTSMLRMVLWQLAQKIGMA